MTAKSGTPTVESVAESTLDSWDAVEYGDTVRYVGDYGSVRQFDYPLTFQHVSMYETRITFLTHFNGKLYLDFEDYPADDFVRVADA